MFDMVMHTAAHQQPSQPNTWTWLPVVIRLRWRRTRCFKVSLTAAAADRSKSAAAHRGMQTAGSSIAACLAWIWRVKGGVRISPLLSGRSWRSAWKRTANDKKDTWQENEPAAERKQRYICNCSRPDRPPPVHCVTSSRHRSVTAWEDDTVNTIYVSSAHLCSRFWESSATKLSEERNRPLFETDYY